ncbi:hypothetical protein MCEMSE6_02507 [Oxalobacteraceae bacterium]
MNTYEFFIEYFGKHILDCEGLTPSAAAWKVLSSSHKQKKGTVSRLTSGWAILRPQKSTIQLELTASGLDYDKRTRYEAFEEELETWDGIEPRMFLTFDKAPIPISNLFLTLDKRLIRICSPKTVESFDITAPPNEVSGIVQRVLWSQKQKAMKPEKKSRKAE